MAFALRNMLDVIHTVSLAEGKMYRMRWVYANDARGGTPLDDDEMVRKWRGSARSELRLIRWALQGLEINANVEILKAENRM